MDNTLTSALLGELNLEIASTRKCLERIPESLFGFKPHPKSMEMGYLSVLVAQIPLWIVHMMEDSVIDFATFPQPKIETNAQLVAYFDQNVEKAKKTLSKAKDKDLDGMFYLKDHGKELYSASKKNDIPTTLNHWVHHRGQLTVYMRLNDIAVPSVYGPSADEKGF
ncbi:damage-inducible protein DinB [Flavobacterium sp. MAH-1]|uniref:Damage-inducible protein DinB n=1 Tax=Flavobacterium agri TaxID=2743471 RepID=A0A7Y9C4H6_9FLAO|nr:DinB family protein [Flavobacterium agri]NUY79890.1 damage-inducible protein DinB [Flavobacterium agri]NYA69915.1 damage-inducible protein DinB [Flavobacterium agri]